MAFDNIDTLVLSGAGFSIIHEFAIAAELQRIYNFKHFIGTSSGSFVALAMAVGWNLDNLNNKLKTAMIGQLPYRDNLLLAVAKLPFKGYLFDHDVRHIILDVILGELSDDNTITFESKIFEGRSLTVLANETTTGQAVVFSNSNSPKVDVRTAILASSALPVLFPTPTVDKSLIVNLSQQTNLPDRLHLTDGALTNFYPIDYAVNLATTIGVFRYPFELSVPVVISPLWTAILRELRMHLKPTPVTDVLPDHILARTLVFECRPRLLDYFTVLTSDRTAEVCKQAKQLALDFINHHQLTSRLNDS